MVKMFTKMSRGKGVKLLQSYVLLTAQGRNDFSAFGAHMVSPDAKAR